MPDLRRNPATALVAALAAAALASCGSDAGGTTTAPGADAGPRLPLPAEEELLQRRRLVTGTELRAAPAASVQRAFYEYWSALENEEWPIALRYFAPAIQRGLETEPFVAALRIELQAPPVKPLIRSVRTARGGQTSVRYYLRQATGALRATSMIWRREGRRWHIVYCSTLDESYARAVQEQAQDGDGPAAAQRAAARARGAQAAAVGATLGG